MTTIVSLKAYPTRSLDNFATATGLRPRTEVE